MAARRMFARAVVSSARFLLMSKEARLLYYDLGMAADDDGCAEALVVMRMGEFDVATLGELVEARFVTILTDELVCYIEDWEDNNRIRPDRYHPGAYRELVEKMRM